MAHYILLRYSSGIIIDTTQSSHFRGSCYFLRWEYIKTHKVYYTPHVLFIACFNYICVIFEMNVSCVLLFQCYFFVFCRRVLPCFLKLLCHVSQGMIGICVRSVCGESFVVFNLNFECSPPLN